MSSELEGSKAPRGAGGAESSAPLATAPLLEVRHLKTWFPVRRGLLGRAVGSVRAVDDVSFTLDPGETLGLVGESGCGKTTIGRSILRLIEPTAGQVLFGGQDVARLSRSELRRTRREFQIIFQDPFSSLNPRMTVGSIVGEGLTIHGVGTRAERPRMVEETLERVGLSKTFVHRYPHEFSGGQRQRIGIARALALRPKLIVCDEAVSALDVSIQAQIINLLVELKREFGIAYLFIAHDLSVVEHVSDRVAVMYLGEIVELAETHELWSRPLHPYTRALLSAVPVPDPTQKPDRILLEGDVPSPLDPPTGCRFHPRCPVAIRGRCDTTAPAELALASGHRFACHVTEDELREAGEALRPVEPAN